MGRKVFDHRQSILLIASVLLAISGSIGFILSYNSVNAVMQQERMDNIEQIGTIVAEKVQSERRRNEEKIVLLSHILLSSQAKTLAEVKALYPEDTSLILAFEDGSFQNLNGKDLVIGDVAVLTALRSETYERSQFTTISPYGDYWIFLEQIQGVSVDGKPLVGIMLPISKSELEKNTTVSIYDNYGITCVINPDGSILMKSSSDTELFAGYNLISAIRKLDLDTLSVECFVQNVVNGKIGKLVAEIHDELWLIHSLPQNTGRSIVVAVPISITAADSFAAMNNAIWYLAVALLGFCSLVSYIFYLMLKRNQTAKLQEERAKAKTDFMNKMSHDIRTPLNGIVGILSLMEGALDDKEEMTDYPKRAKLSGRYLVSIINDILDMSKIENDKMVIAHQPFSMADLLDNVVSMQTLPAKEKDLSFLFEKETPITTNFVGDSVRICQCLVNLLSNAIKFTDHGGTVRLLYKEAHHGEKSTVTFAVSDTGVGMSKAYLERLFQPFEQEQNSLTHVNIGSGLGLTIVKNLIDLMGGTISIESELGKGSTFTLQLSLETAELTQQTELTPQALNRQLAGKRILLAEDHPTNRLIVCKILKSLGLLVETAANGQAAWELFQKSEPGYYNLVLMDVQMPILNGLESAEKIRRTDHPDSHSIPIVALSANAYEEDAQKSKRAGMQEHLAKPVEIEQLARILRKYL